MTTSDASPGTLSELRHPGRIVVSQGFTVARLMLVALIAEIVEWRGEEALDKIGEKWRNVWGITVNLYNQHHANPFAIRYADRRCRGLGTVHQVVLRVSRKQYVPRALL